MRMVDLIEKKRDGEILTKDEIQYFIRGVSNGSIPDYQTSAFLMAVLFQGMNEEETSFLTDAMEHSGETINLSKIQGATVDKHSTGGVGDKTSLALGPLVASCGAKLAKMSGRGLGHTGGTLDKLESIPGFKIQLSIDDFIHQVNEIGLAIVGQTKEVDPADKKLYALRDVTGTVESIPLIASSIMSKKLAAGADTILLDVKVGAGAFMKTKESAQELAHLMVKIGKHLNRDTRAILTGMEEPLGYAVGNALEVKEAIDELNGHGPKDFHELILKAGSIMLCQAKIAKTEEEGERKIQEAIDNRKGLEKLKEMVIKQGGDVSYIENPCKFPISSLIIPVYAEKDGYVHHIDSLAIGLTAMRLGAGRATMQDEIDHSSGIVLAKKVGDFVQKGDVLCTLYTNKEDIGRAKDDASDAFLIKKEKIAAPSILLDYIR